MPIVGSPPAMSPVRAAIPASDAERSGGRGHRRWVTSASVGYRRHSAGRELSGCSSSRLTTSRRWSMPPLRRLRRGCASWRAIPHSSTASAPDAAHRSVAGTRLHCRDGSARSRTTDDRLRAGLHRADQRASPRRTAAVPRVGPLFRTRLTRPASRAVRDGRPAGPHPVRQLP